LGEAGVRIKKISIITFSICQSSEMEGCCKAKITINESPLIVNVLNFKEIVTAAARSVDKDKCYNSLVFYFIWTVNVT
jgi:hypothetical protein